MRKKWNELFIVGIKLLLCMIIFLSISQAWATCPGEGGPGDGSATPAPPGHTGTPGEGADPVILHNGSFIANTKDLVVKGKMLDIEIRRYYNSSPSVEKFKFDATGYFKSGDGCVWNSWNLPTGATDATYANNNKIVSFKFSNSQAGEYQAELNIAYSCRRLAGIYGIIYYCDDEECYDDPYYEPNIPSPFYPEPGLSELTFPFYYAGNWAGTKFGKNWNLNYNIFLVEINSDVVILKYEGFKNVIFKKNTSGDFEPQSEKAKFDILTESSSIYTLKLKDSSEWEFNSSLNIASIEDKNGNELTFTYTSGDLTQITNDLGRTVTLTYANDKLVSVKDDYANRTVAYAYDTNGHLITATSPATTEYSSGLATTYSYNTFTGDDNVYIDTIKGGDNVAWLDNNWSSTTKKITTQSYGGNTFTFSYDEDNRVTTISDRRGYSTQYYYDGYGQTTREIRWEGTVGSSTSYETKYVRNASTTALEEIEYPKGNSIEMAYDSSGNLTTLTRSHGNISLTYDSRNLIQTVTDYESNQYSLEYDYEDSGYGSTVGNLMKVTYPQVNNENNSNVTPEIEFTYNSSGQIETVETTDDIIIKYEYGTTGDDNGRCTQITYDYGTGQDNLNIIYQLAYDKYGNIETITKPDSENVNLTYNALDQLTQIENELGYITKLSYSNRLLLTKTQQQIGSTFSTSTAQTLEYDHDIYGHIDEVTDFLGNLYTVGRDNSENVTWVMDPEGDAATTEYKTQYQYNERDLLDRITDAEGNYTYLEYDDNGNVTKLKDDNSKETTYSYDNSDRMYKIEYADSSYEQFTLDDNDNVTQDRKRDGTIIYYTYDALNRMTSKQIGAGTTTYYRYDIAGRLRYVLEDTTQVASFSYDRVGRLTSTTDSISKTVGYEYNDNGQRTKLTYPDSSYITYHYDDAERLQYIKDDSATPVTLVTFYWDELSRLTKTAYANGEYEEYDYEDASTGDDDKGNNIEQVSYSVSSMNSYDYIRDMIGNITDRDYGSLNFDFVYNNIYQLTAATNQSGTISYDGVYNRTSVGSTTYTLETNGLNQYDTVGTASLSYGNNGNLTNDGTYKYEYDHENRMTAVKEQNDDSVAVHTYDWAGRRNLRTYGSVSTKYVYDGDQVVAEYEGTTLKRKFIYGPGIDFPVMMITVDGETETKYYYFRDAQGSIVALLNNSGSVVQGYTYDAFGKPKYHIAVGSDGKWLTSDDGIRSAPPYSNPYMFTARRFDPLATDKGIYYYRARMYNPELGRFMQPDPIGYYDSMNLYQYCMNNPINFVDPYGESWGWIGRIIRGIIGVPGIPFPSTWLPDTEMGDATLEGERRRARERERSNREYMRRLTGSNGTPPGAAPAPDPSDPAPAPAPAPALPRYSPRPPTPPIMRAPRIGDGLSSR